MVFSDTPPLPAGEQRREEEDVTAPRPAQSPEDRRLVERVERALCTTGHGACAPLRSLSTVGLSSSGVESPVITSSRSRRRPCLPLPDRTRSRTVSMSSDPSQATKVLCAVRCQFGSHEDRAFAMNGSA